MDFERKSERNQMLHEQRKHGRKARRHLSPKSKSPRFAPNIRVPEILAGIELHKFYSQPVLLPARTEGEPLVGRTPYTQRQIETLEGLVDRRNHTVLIGSEERAIRVSGIKPLIDLTVENPEQRTATELLRQMKNRRTPFS